jgi:hypothetical protein
MAQAAAVDLPDPLDQATAPLANADELLAQLAGDEIDRLLADSDVDRQPPPAEQAEIPPPKLQTPVAADTLGSEINDLFKELKEQSVEKPAAPQTPPAKTDATKTEPPAPARVAEVVQSDPTERAALLAAAGFESALTAGAVADHSPADAHISFDDPPAPPAEPPLPIYLKPLQWLNAPMAMFSDSARSILGKVALVTLFNSAAILAYVLFFRKH